MSAIAAPQLAASHLAPSLAPPPPRSPSSTSAARQLGSTRAELGGSGGGSVPLFEEDHGVFDLDWISGPLFEPTDPWREPPAAPPVTLTEELRQAALAFVDHLGALIELCRGAQADGDAAASEVLVVALAVSGLAQEQATPAEVARILREVEPPSVADDAPAALEDIFDASRLLDNARVVGSVVESLVGELEHIDGELHDARQRI